MEEKEKKHINEGSLVAGVLGMVGGGFDNTVSPASFNVQGKQPGYIYSIHDLNDTLQQPKNPTPREYYIYPGCTVRGRGYNYGDKTYTGVVNRIVKNGKGEVVCLYIQSLKTAKLVTIRADENLELILPKTPYQYTTHRVATEENIDISQNCFGFN